MKKAKKSKAKTIIIAAVLIVLLAIAVIIILGRNHVDAPDNTDPESESGSLDGNETEELELLDLGSDIYVVGCSNYAGMYVEDGSDDIISDIPVVTVENKGSEMVQLMNFTLVNANGTEYEFELTTLLPGSKMTVLEKNRAAYEDGEIASGTVNSFAVFSEEPSLHTDILRLSCEGNVITVANISDETVPAGRVFYKNISGDLLVGGITYMASFPEIAPGEAVSLNASHFTEGQSAIVFVTYAG